MSWEINATEEKVGATYKLFRHYMVTGRTLPFGSIHLCPECAARIRRGNMQWAIGDEKFALPEEPVVCEVCHAPLTTEH